MNQDENRTELSGSLPVELLRQTFQIRTPAGVGTAFTVEVNERQYIVTAQHLVGSVVPKVIEMRLSASGWQRGSCLGGRSS